MDKQITESDPTKKLHIYRFVISCVFASVLLGILSTIVFVKLVAIPLYKAGFLLNPTPDLSIGRLFGVWCYCFVYWFGCCIVVALINNGLGKTNSIWPKVDRWVRNFICFFIAGGVPSFFFLFFSFVAGRFSEPHSGMGHDIPSILINMFMTFLLLIMPLFIPGLITACVGVIVGPFVELR